MGPANQKGMSVSEQLQRQRQNTQQQHQQQQRPQQQHPQQQCPQQQHQKNFKVNLILVHCQKLSL